MDKQNSIVLTNFDTFIGIVSLVLLFISWTYIIVHYRELPETIAVHFNGNGVANGYDNKKTIWIAPIIFTLLTFIMLYGAKNPYLFDLTKKITSQKQAVASSKTLLFSSVLLSFTLFMIVYSMVNASIPNAQSYEWVFPVLITSVVIFLVVIFSINIKFKRK